MEEGATDWAAIWATIGAFWQTWRTPLTVVLIVIGAFVLNWVLRRVIAHVVDRIVTGVKRRNRVEDTQALQASPLAAVRVVQRTRALGGLLTGIATATVALVTTLVLISILFPNATGAFALLSAAVGAGLGFGAQNIVKDVLNGLFMVSEDQLGVGDIVDLGPATGVVEHVGIRITRVRDVNGTVWFVRNGEIQRVGNMSLGWARVIIDLAVPYEVDTDEVQQRILDTALALAATPKWRGVIIDRPEVWGIESITTDAVIIRLVMKSRSSSRDDVARELRARLKADLDEAGIRLPSLTTVLLAGADGAASVRGARPPRTAPLPLSEPAATHGASAPRTPRSPRTPRRGGAES